MKIFAAEALLNHLHTNAEEAISQRSRALSGLIASTTGN